MVIVPVPLVKLVAETVAVQGGLPTRVSSTVTVPKEALIVSPVWPLPRFAEVGTVIVNGSARQNTTAGAAMVDPDTGGVPMAKVRTIDAANDRQARFAENVARLVVMTFLTEVVPQVTHALQVKRSGETLAA
ncbi:hypothetical protein [Nonomuraea sp. NPDC050786]|uniref:hypothetical protein n=1 Tax=Nonomuraea sp. NPDC050786 TaxID=3154840 RepID=UPI0033C2797A